MNEFLGDGRAVAVAVEALTNGRSVDLRGLPGSGRTVAVQEICALMISSGWKVVTLPCPSLPGSMMLAPFMFEGMFDDAADLGRADLYDVVGNLSGCLREGRTVIVIDGADQLEQPLMSAILLARHPSRTPVLTTTRPGVVGLRSSLFAHLAPSVRVDLPPLRHDEIDLLLRSQLQIAFEPGSLGLITNICGGLPGLALSVTESLRRRGRLVRVGAGWRVDELLWSSDLSAVAEQYLVPLSDQAVLALHALSAAGTLTVAQARSLSVWDEFEDLESFGLVHVLDVLDAQEIAVYPPIIAEYFRHEGRAIARHKVDELLGKDIDLAPRTSADGFCAAASSGRATTLLSYRVRGFWENEVLSRRMAWIEDRSPRTAMRYLIALDSVSTGWHTMSEVIEATPMTGPALARVLLLGWRACHLSIVRGCLDDAIALVRQNRADLAEFDGALRAVEAHITFVTSGIPNEGLLVDPVADEARMSTDFLRTTRAEVLMARGLQRQAIEVLDRGAENNVGLMCSDDVVRGMAKFLDGDIDGAITWAEEKFDSLRTGLDLSWWEGHAYVTAIGLALTGRIAAFDSHMAMVSSMASHGINVHFLSATFAHASAFATMRGQRETAVAYAEQAMTFDRGVDLYPGIPSRIALALATDHDQGARIVWEATERRIAAGYTTSALLLGMIALERDPDTAHARQLVGLAMSTESPLLRQLAQYASAVVNADADELSRVSRSLAGAGLTLYSVRAAVRACEVLRMDGQIAAASNRAVKLWASLRTSAPDLIQLLAPFAEGIDLTAREKEVVAMLSADLSAAEIAERLVLSVRTVEQHTLRACRKLGVTKRGDLVSIARTWLGEFLQ